MFTANSPMIGFYKNYSNCFIYFVYVVVGYLRVFCDRMAVFAKTVFANFRSESVVTRAL